MAENKSVIIRFDCWHTHTMPFDQAKKYIVGERMFCFKCGKKRLVTWREEI